MNRSLWTWPIWEPNPSKIGVYRITDNVCDLIIAADYYGFSSVLTNCSTFLIKLLTISSCISIWSFSNDFNLSEVEEAAFDYILRHFVKVMNHLRRLYSSNPFSDIQNGVGVHCTSWTDVQSVNNERMAQRGREGDKWSDRNMAKTPKYKKRRQKHWKRRRITRTNWRDNEKTKEFSRFHWTYTNFPAAQFWCPCR